MLYENNSLFERTRLQMLKDKERIMCKLISKRAITQCVIHEGCEMQSCSQIVAFCSPFGLGKKMFNL